MFIQLKDCDEAIRLDPLCFITKVDDAELWLEFEVWAKDHAPVVWDKKQVVKKVLAYQKKISGVSDFQHYEELMHVADLLSIGDFTVITAISIGLKHVSGTDAIKVGIKRYNEILASLGRS